MERKEVKIQVPEGYEIDEENSTFECIKFKPLKKFITYNDVARSLLSKNQYFIHGSGKIFPTLDSLVMDCCNDKNNATNKKQLGRLLALNQLLNIAEYYNKVHTIHISNNTIMYDGVNQIYVTSSTSTMYSRGIEVIFNRQEDAQAVIDNPNFREILDMVYKN
nr:MAG TPA: hypothetical protein [Bacteriophage sp.]